MSNNDKREAFEAMLEEAAALGDVDQLRMMAEAADLRRRAVVDRLRGRVDRALDCERLSERAVARAFPEDIGHVCRNCGRNAYVPGVGCPGCHWIDERDARAFPKGGE